jgi:hypothetical protein
MNVGATTRTHRGAQISGLRNGPVPLQQRYGRDANDRQVLHRSVIHLGDARTELETRAQNRSVVPPECRGCRDGRGHCDSGGFRLIQSMPGPAVEGAHRRINNVREQRLLGSEVKVERSPLDIDGAAKSAADAWAQVPASSSLVAISSSACSRLSPFVGGSARRLRRGVTLIPLTFSSIERELRKSTCVGNLSTSVD